MTLRPCVRACAVLISMIVAPPGSCNRRDCGAKDRHADGEAAEGDSIGSILEASGGLSETIDSLLLLARAEVTMRGVGAQPLAIVLIEEVRLNERSCYLSRLWKTLGCSS